MPRVPLRELVFDAGCLLAGKAGRVFGHRLSRPAFIVGTGRCGTTLLVRMLKTHRGLAGFPGEANELWHPALEPFERTQLPTPPIEVDPAGFTRVSLAHWPANQGERLREVFSGFHLLTGASKVVFTKSAMISFMIPTILQLFPDARIVHIYRFGPSVVQSYVKKNFGKYSRFVFQEKQYKMICARYWNACIMEIEEKTRELAATQFLEFSYERLCQNPRGVLDEVGLFLGVIPSGFGFDTSEVSNRNLTAEDAPLDPDRPELLEVMSPALVLKGYIARGNPATGLA